MITFWRIRNRPGKFLHNFNIAHVLLCTRTIKFQTEVTEIYLSGALIIPMYTQSSPLIRRNGCYLLRVFESLDSIRLIISADLWMNIVVRWVTSLHGRLQSNNRSIWSQSNCGEQLCDVIGRWQWIFLSINQVLPRPILCHNNRSAKLLLLFIDLIHSLTM